ncbi:hypothetical protein GUJ93_ZPchr0008g13047 [Zizania palustris]|uniref:Uncharacterized protein n=1 Tax=Zizania palustris TaxID=103762 RepID=A0A8J5RCL2_ZIZPA|nr:hypothetical protein GUJ93_ZPchr0008g13047 [Zizania palustris]
MNRAKHQNNPEEKVRDGSPVDGFVQQQQSSSTASGQTQQQKVALITLLLPREVARPEMPRVLNLVAGCVNEEEWITVLGDISF